MFDDDFADVFADEGGGVAFGTDEEDVALFGDDIAVEAVDDGQAAVGELDDVVAAVLHEYVAVDDDIVAGALAHAFVDGMPRAQVCPSEVARHDIDVVGALEDALVDAELGVGGVVLVDEGHLLLDVVLEAVVVKLVDDVGEELAEAVVEVAGVGEDEAGVPQELAALHEHAGEVALGLLGEALYAIEVAVGRLVALLDVSVAGFRTGGLDTHGEEDVIAAGVAEGFVDVAEEGFLVEHELVAGGDDDDGVSVAAADAHIGPCHAGCRSTVDGFYHDVLFVDVGQLLSHQGGVLLVGADEDVLLGQDFLEAVEGLLQLGSSGAEEVDELLRFLFAAAGPESVAAAASEYYAVVIGRHVDLV